MLFDYAPLSSEAAEQDLLAAILRRGLVALEAVGEVLTPRDFFFPVHGRIFAACLRLRDDGREITPAILGQYFEGDADLEEHGGPRYLTALASSPTASVMAAPDLARTIRDLAARRRFVEHCVGAIALVQDRSPDAPTLPQVIAETAQRLESIDSGGSRARTKRQVAATAVEAMSRPAVCYSTGLRCIDKAMGGGLYPGRSYGIEALDKRGKTTLAGTISANLNALGCRHAYLPFEMGAEQIELRNLARHLQTSAFKLICGSDHILLHDTVEYSLEAPDNTIYLDMQGRTFTDLKTELSRLRSKERITGFIIDYWQLVGGTRGRTAQLEEHLREVAQWIAAFCVRHKLWSIVLAQLNEEGTAFGSRRGLQMACDQVYILHRDPESPEAWLGQRVTRYTPPVQVGSAQYPSLYLEAKGPYFRDAWMPEDGQ